jgi:hypothetical protein
MHIGREFNKGFDAKMKAERVNRLPKAGKMVKIGGAKGRAETGWTHRQTS